MIKEDLPTFGLPIKHILIVFFNFRFLIYLPLFEVNVYYGRTSISLGSTYAGRRSGSGTPDGGRPLCAYNLGYGNVIPYYHGNGYSGGYKGSGWHWDCTTWIRQY